MGNIRATTHLTEGEADAAPSPEDVVSGGALLHTGVGVLEVPAGHAAAGVAWLRAATQALLVAALAPDVTRAMLTAVQAH